MKVIPALLIGVLYYRSYFKTSYHWECILKLVVTLLIIQFMVNWSMMKKRIPIGSLIGPNFAIRTALKMNRSRINFAKLLL